MGRKRAGMPLILMYHSVDHYDEDPYQVTVSPPAFDRQLRWLRGRGLRGVSVGELRAARRAGRSRGLVGLTFDDGYADFAARVAPELRRRGFTATVFMVAGHVGADNRWDGGPRKPLMTADELRHVASLGMEIGSHGMRHVSLPAADAAGLRGELRDSRAALEDIVERPVTGFAYPYGHVSRREAAAVRAAGYDYACAIWRSEVSGDHALARTYVGERDRALRLRAKVGRHAVRWRTRV